MGEFHRDGGGRHRGDLALAEAKVTHLPPLCLCRDEAIRAQPLLTHLPVLLACMFADFHLYLPFFRLLFV